MSTAPESLRDQVCLGCGCLCDDLEIRFNSPGEIVADQACELGRETLRRRFNETLALSRVPIAAIEGRATTVVAATAAITLRLRAARSPLILLGEVSCETASAAVGLADRAGGKVARADPGESASFAFQRDGAVTATLGEVRDRSDLIVYWCVEPKRFPRHRERFVSDRSRVIEVIEGGTEFPLVPKGFDHRHAELFAAIRAVIGGRLLDTNRAEHALGLTPGWISKFTSLLTNSNHGALFLGSVTAIARGEAMRLVTDLNRDRRFIGLGMGNGANSEGIDAALAWGAGFPGSVDFSVGYPRGSLGELTERNKREAFDLVIGITSGDDAVPGDVTLAPNGGQGAIRVNVGRLGIDDGGTVARVDGVMLPSGPVISTARPSAAGICRAVQALWDAGDRAR